MAAAAPAVITTQWVMGDLEKVGMLKMDFLGLRTLTVVDNTLQADPQDPAGQSPIDWDTIPPGDAENLRLAPARRRQGRVPA